MKKHDGCKGCRYIRKQWWEHPCRACKGMEDVIKKDYWKPCDNMWVDSNTRLPEIGTEVLCITVYGFYTIGVLEDVWRDSDRHQQISAVTHWMPLPEPPEEAKE